MCNSKEHLPDQALEESAQRQRGELLSYKQGYHRRIAVGETAIMLLAGAIGFLPRVGKFVWGSEESKLCVTETRRGIKMYV